MLYREKRIGENGLLTNRISENLRDSEQDNIYTWEKETVKTKTVNEKLRKIAFYERHPTI